MEARGSHPPPFRGSRDSLWRGSYRFGTRREALIERAKRWCRPNLYTCWSAVIIRFALLIIFPFASTHWMFIRYFCFYLYFANFYALTLTFSFSLSLSYFLTLSLSLTFFLSPSLSLTCSFSLTLLLTSLLFSLLSYLSLSFFNTFISFLSSNSLTFISTFLLSPPASHSGPRNIHGKFKDPKLPLLGSFLVLII